MRASCRHDQKIVRVRNPIDSDALTRDVDAAHLSEEHGGVALRAQDMPQWCGNGRCREAGGRHLVEQRLKRMVIDAIDQQYVDRGAAQPAYRGKPAKSAADYDDPWPCMHGDARSAQGRELAPQLHRHTIEYSLGC